MCIMCVCRYMKKSIFQILNIGVGLLGFVTILFAVYCFGKLNEFNPFIYTLLGVGIILTAFSMKICTNDFNSRCLLRLYLFILCMVFLIEVSLVVVYFDDETHEWLMQQLPGNIQNLVKQYIQIIGLVFLGVAVTVVIMFAFGIEILYFKTSNDSTNEEVGPNTYLLGDSDINNLIGNNTNRSYKAVEKREQGTQYQLEAGGYLCTKCYRIECECFNDSSNQGNTHQESFGHGTSFDTTITVVSVSTDEVKEDDYDVEPISTTTVGDGIVLSNTSDNMLSSPNKNSSMLCLKCHDLQCTCEDGNKELLCSVCFERPCKCNMKSYT